MKKVAKFWKEMPGGKVGCSLCPWRCTIADGKVGVCRARKNEGGKLYSLVYGSLVSMAVDPIEKKPFYHFYPGSTSFSISAPGCNFSCGHCQNWSISQASVESVPFEDVPPEKVIELAKRYGCKGISHTYTEPTIWSEYAIDVGKLAHRSGLYNSFVTNGYITIEALEELGPYLDASNVDVKAFTDRFYKEVCHVAGIRPVLATCEWLVENDKHLEVTYLVIPGENDSSEEIYKFCKWAAEKLGPNVPIHFSRFYPHYRMADREPTPVRTLEGALDIAKKAGLLYVYIGNVPGHEFDNTYCPKCGEMLVERQGFDILQYKLKDHKCHKCGAEINIRGEYSPVR
ncbi:MAG: AmmeMemoRadiSam system radical SAM enzyme [Candidatus Hadarchaeota archaeon]